MEKKKINFFGYGALSIKDRLSQIIGRDPGEGKSSIVKGYNLAIQVLDQIPESVRESLRTVWGDSFKAYTLKKGSGLVKGVVWELTAEDIKKIRFWELEGAWRDKVEVKVSLTDGKLVAAETMVVKNNLPIKEIVDGLNYDPELNPYGEWKIKEAELRREELERLNYWRAELKKMQLQRLPSFIS